MDDTLSAWRPPLPCGVFRCGTGGPLGLLPAPGLPLPKSNPTLTLLMEYPFGPDGEGEGVFLSQVDLEDSDGLGRRLRGSATGAGAGVGDFEVMGASGGGKEETWRCGVREGEVGETERDRGALEEEEEREDMEEAEEERGRTVRGSRED